MSKIICVMGDCQWSRRGDDWDRVCTKRTVTMGVKGYFGDSVDNMTIIKAPLCNDYESIREKYDDDDYGEDNNEQ